VNSSTDQVRSNTQLFDPFTVRGITFPNRIGVSPMCMYAATDGLANDYHLVHLGRFALGGAGLVVVEATAIASRGRISHHDLGLWSSDHIGPLRRVAEFVRRHGAVPGIQLAHAGRKASVREPWNGGTPLDETDTARGLAPWTVEAPSPIPAGPGWPVPQAMSEADIARSVEDWSNAAMRAVDAGFQFIELHGAHGYLLHSFLSPVSNHRADAYGGEFDNRMRYPLEVIRAVRGAIPEDVVLSYRCSVVDGFDGGLTVNDTIHFASAAQSAGVDIIDTSSGGISTDRKIDTRIPRGYAFHADYAREIKAAIELPVATVGMIVDPEQASLLIASGVADFVLLGREMLFNPQWAHHARLALDEGDEFDAWHEQAASFLKARRSLQGRLAEAGETPTTRFLGIEETGSGRRQT